jgi:signal transduction histidine kinase
MTRRAGLVDAALAIALSSVGVVEAAAGLTVGREPWPLVLSVLLVTAPVAWRRSRPGPVLAVVLVVLVVQAAVGSELGGGFAEPVALVLVVWSAASRLPSRAALLAGAAALAGVLTVVAFAGDYRPGNFVYAATVTLVAWLGGKANGLAAQRNKLLVEQARTREAEHVLREQAALTDQRVGLARELHDVVSHRVSAIVVQASAARREGGGAADQTLVTIEEQGRQTLVELRRLLGVLRHDHPDQPVPVTPVPRVSDLSPLVETARSVGLDVHVERVGTPGQLPAALDHAAYRIVQEALTNVRKHSTAGEAFVRLECEGDRLAVEVRDAGPSRRDAGLTGAGVGLNGIRERVAAFGGSVDAGPRDTGFAVRAVLPLGEA